MDEKILKIGFKMIFLFIFLILTYAKTVALFDDF